MLEESLLGSIGVTPWNAAYGKERQKLLDKVCCYKISIMFLIELSPIGYQSLLSLPHVNKNWIYYYISKVLSSNLLPMNFNKWHFAADG